MREIVFSVTVRLPEQHVDDAHDILVDILNEHCDIGELAGFVVGLPPAVD